MASTSQEKRIVVLISGSGSNLQALIDSITTNSLPNSKITQVISNRKNAFGLERAKKMDIPTTVFNLKTWSNQTGGNREEYDKVLARKVLLGSEGKSHLKVKGQDGQGENGNDGDLDLKGKEREKERENIAEGIVTKEGESSSEILPDLIILAGFMHILSPSFLQIISDSTSNAKKEIPIINLHPALPGQFDGSEAIERAFQSFKNGTLKNDTTGAMVHKVVAEVDRGQPVVIEEIKLDKDETLESLKEKIHKVEHRIIVEGARKVLEENP